MPFHSKGLDVFSQDGIIWVRKRTLTGRIPASDGGWVRPKYFCLSLFTVDEEEGMMTMSRSWTLFLGLILLALPLGCGAKPQGGFLLAGAFFESSAPLPARLLIARPPADPEADWDVEVLESGDNSNVFHKSLYFTPLVGEPGILTISGSPNPTPAYVKLWRKKGDSWEAETLYSGVYGGKFDRCRDMELADVTGDGIEDIVVVTHQRGVVIVIEQKDGKFVPREISSTIKSWVKSDDAAEEKSLENQEPVWIHEVETGDVNGDGTIEFFTTPSAPNNLSGDDQPGDIVMFRHENGEFKETLIEAFVTRHAKEILCAQLDKSEPPMLFAAIEGEAIGGDGGGATTLIKGYTWKDGKSVAEEIMPLPGKLCRFMSCSDTDGDGKNELIASTSKNGIYSIFKDENGSWKKRSIASGSISSGFEHASLCVDWDGDGRDEVFAVSDNAKVFRRFFYDAERERYQSEKLLNFDYNSIFIFNIEVLPPGM